MVIVLAPVRIARFAVSTLVTGASTVPDAARLSTALVSNGGRNVSMADFNMARERILSLVAFVWVLGIGGVFAFLVDWTPPPEPQVLVSHWTTGHLTRDGLLFDMRDEFNDAEHRTEDGTLIQVDSSRSVQRSV
jgi:hypothetical protein